MMWPGLRLCLVFHLALLVAACRSVVSGPPRGEVSMAASPSSGSPTVGSAHAFKEQSRSPTVRPPAVAGRFYPEQPELLRSKVEGFLAAAPVTALPGPLVGLMVPHAGYEFSGRVAAAAYKLLQNQSFRTVVLLGPTHRWPLEGAALPAEEAFRTPLGEVPVNRKLVQHLLDSQTGFVTLPEAHAEEHSLEVQIPFLQCTLDHFDLVPICCGDLTLNQATRLARGLAAAIRGQKVLLVASSDMSHYPAYDDAVRCDKALLAAIATGEAKRVLAADREWMDRHIPNLVCSLCGLWPVVVWLETAKELGVSGIQVLKYANSGDVPVIGDKKQVVGYGAVALYRTGPESLGAARNPSKQKEKTTMTQDKARPPEEGELSPEQQAEVLRIARLSVESHVKEGRPPVIQVADPALKRPCGAFVTLKEKGNLRGCIGSLQATEPLAETVIEMAGAAALRDPRFEPVQPEELPAIDIEVSVLTPLRRISDVNEIEVGRHGLYIVHGIHRGVLLPQVATEQGWEREQFLQHTCLKAGLSPDDWQKGAQIYVFTAQVFGEKEIHKPAEG